MNKIINYITSNYKSEAFWLFTIIAIIIGIIAGSTVSWKLYKKRQDIKVNLSLDKCILWASFIGAIGCLISSFLGEQTVSVQILSFYVSFIFAWLLTKDSSQKDFKKMQHKVAKNTYRHIEDVETTVLITKKRVEKLCGKETSIQGELQGIVDDLNSILTGIRSNKDDWKDMLKRSYREKIDAQEDPEGKLEKLEKAKTQPASSEYIEVFKDSFKKENNNDTVASKN